MAALDKKKTVFIATFSPWKNGVRLPINGNLEPMLDFFVSKVKKVVLIDQVYPGSDFVMPRIEIYKNKKRAIYRSSWWMYTLYPFLKLTSKPGTHIPFKLRDFLSVFDWFLKDPTKYDYFIGFEAINAIAGIFSRDSGRVKTVIYYVSDYSPNRYKNRWFNAIYLWLDRYAAMHADYIWDVSHAMQPARIQAGLDPKKSAPVLHVPNALYPEQIAAEDETKLEPYSLVFMGTLGVENGPDLAIKALPLVLKKYPKTRLHIVGGGEDETRLKKLAKKLKIDRSVIFHGFIADRIEVSKTIRKFMVALAPYAAIPGSARFYGDATKIRVYLAAGLPVITTSVPPLGKEVNDFGAGIIVHENQKDLAEATIKLFSNKNQYLTMRKKAIAFAKENTWDNEFKKAFAYMKA